MGLFDATLTPWGEHFQEGQPFTLEGVRVGPEVPTEYGRGRPAMLKIGGQWYSLFGQALLNQVENAEEGDFPAEVKIVRVPNKSGTQQYKMIVPANADAPDEIPF